MLSGAQPVSNGNSFTAFPRDACIGALHAVVDFQLVVDRRTQLIRKNARDSKDGVVAGSRADYHRGTLRLVIDYFTALDDRYNPRLQAPAALEAMS